MEKLEPHPDINLIVVADHGMHDINPPEVSMRYVGDYLENRSYITEPEPVTSCNLMAVNGHTSEEILNRLELLTSTGKYKVYRQVLSIASCTS